MTTIRIKRVAGAYQEILEGYGMTTLDAPFDCPSDIAGSVLNDGSERFQEA